MRTYRVAAGFMPALAAVLAFTCISCLFAQTPTTVPRIWNEADLATWATPVATLNVAPAHFTEEEYYRVPADNFKTYPVYPPDREPPGYWEWLHQQKPEPLVDASKMHSTSDWIAAGERAFRDLDAVLSRTDDPSSIARARDPESFKDTYTLPDGSVLDPRWVITDKGLMLTSLDCGNCHVRATHESGLLFGEPLAAWPSDLPGVRPPGLPILDFFSRTFSRLFLDEDFGMSYWRTVVVPWAPEERVDRLREMKDPGGLGPLFGNNTGTVPRTNGSPFYGSKVPDLHTLRFYRYLDATATHRLRGPEDVARYSALVTGADPMEFGPHHMLTTEQRRVAYRYADEVLFAIGQYLLSLEPPKNPNVAYQPAVDAGNQVFNEQGCAKCHTPPDYTNGMLTPAIGFEPPAEHPFRNDIMNVSVGTDPGVALKTRKGTGLYKVPSLRGVWYRPFLLHDGSVASLEELFDPERLEPSHVPGGWRPPGTSTQTIQGHPFGLGLTPDQKTALLAFLRSL